MPANTPNRGYTYPLYSEPTMDFPAAIQELAEDIDTDVALLETVIDSASNRPSMRVFNNLTQNIPNSVLTNLSWAGSGTDYDSGPLFNPLVGFELSEQGIYLLEVMVEVTAPGAGTVFGTSLTMVSTGGVATNPTRISLRAHPTQDTWLQAATLHYVTGAAPDQISIQFWHNQGGSVAIPFRTISATKISNVAGEF